MTAGPGEEIISLKGFGGGTLDAQPALRPRRQEALRRRRFAVPTSRPAKIPAAPPSTATTRTAAATRSTPPAPATPSACAGIRAPTPCGPPCRSATSWATTSSPTTSPTSSKGGFYGWPFAYSGPHEDPRNKGERPGSGGQDHSGPTSCCGAHVAVLDFIFYTGKQFPKRISGRRVPGLPRLVEPLQARRPVHRLRPVQGRQAFRSDRRRSSPAGCWGRMSAKSGDGRWRSCKCPTAAC